MVNTKFSLIWCNLSQYANISLPKNQCEIYTIYLDRQYFLKIKTEYFFPSNHTVLSHHIPPPQYCSSNTTTEDQTISRKNSMLDLLLAAWSKFLTSLINSLILLLVLSNSFSWECKESRKYGESWRHSVNSNGKSPIVDFWITIHFTDKKL